MKVKGAALRSTMNYIREHFPPAAIEKVLSRVSPEDQKILRRPLLVSDWYESKILIALMRAAGKETDQDERSLFHAMGRQSCDDGLNTVYKIFYKLGSPSFIVSKGLHLWNNYYSDGVIATLESSPTMAHIRLTRNPFPDEAMCIRLSGWFERSLELSGGKAIGIHHIACVHHGQENCEWRGTWEL